MWWDGQVNPCDVDYKSKLSIGNIKNSDISQLWKSAQYSELRKKHESKMRSKVLPCNRCSFI